MANFITSSNSTPSGLAYVAYGDPERYAQVKNQILKEIDLSSSKLKTYNPQLVIDSIDNELKSIFSSKYGFISSSDISKFSSNLYTKIVNEIDSISSYRDSIYSDLSLYLSSQFKFISSQEASIIISDLFNKLKGKNSSNSPAEIKSFPSLIDSEISSNDLTKISSLPSNSVIDLVSSLLPGDFQSIGQSIQDFNNDPISTISNIASLASSAINGLTGYPSNAILSPSDANGKGAQNLSDSSQVSSNKGTELVSEALINLNLAFALAYDPNKDTFNPSESSIYNLSTTLTSSSPDFTSNPGSNFRPA